MVRARHVRKRARRDDNHNEIVRHFEALGVTVLDTSNISGGLDIVVGCGGIDQRVEIKNPKVDSTHRKLTKAEQDEFDLWRGRKPVIVMDIEDVIKLVHQMRREGCILRDYQTKRGQI